MIKARILGFLGYGHLVHSIQAKEIPLKYIYVLKPIPFIIFIIFASC